MIRSLLRSNIALFQSRCAFVANRGCSTKMEGDCTPPETQDVSDWPGFKALLTPEMKELVSYFNKHNHVIRVAGGAVRDLLQGKDVDDVDLATTATPEEMIEMFNAEGVRMIKETGIKHGTVTPRIILDKENAPDEGENYEVTTLRIDGETVDGRRPSVVEFTKNWRLDAERRDLTINSLFLGLDGIVYDFYGGRKDLEARRVAFVGDADKRIKEDYLRILRYFRFYGRIANDPDSHENHTLKAVTENAEGLKLISGERIWIELKKILSGKFAGSLTKSMEECGLNKHIGFPENVNHEELKRVCELTKSLGLSLSPGSLLGALLTTEGEVLQVHSRLKLSCLERDTALFVIKHRNSDNLSLKTCKCLWVDAKSKSVEDTKTIIGEVIKYRGDVEMLKVWEETEIPKMPVSGRDINEAGCPRGPLIGHVLDALKEKWKESDFKMTHEELMGGLPDVIDTAVGEHKKKLNAIKEARRKSKSPVRK